MDFVKERPAAHRNLAVEKFVIKQCRHRSAKKQILLDLLVRRPGHMSLMSQRVAASQRNHSSNSPPLSKSRHLSMTVAFAGLNFIGMSGINGICGGRLS